MKAFSSSLLYRWRNRGSGSWGDLHKVKQKAGQVGDSNLRCLGSLLGTQGHDHRVGPDFISDRQEWGSRSGGRASGGVCLGCRASRASVACGGSLGSQDCSQPAWSSHSDLLHPPPSFRCRRGEPARLAMSGRGQEEQGPILVPDAGLLHPRLLLPGPQPAGEVAVLAEPTFSWEHQRFQAVPTAGEARLQTQRLGFFPMELVEPFYCSGSQLSHPQRGARCPPWVK